MTAMFLEFVFTVVVDNEPDGDDALDEEAEFEALNEEIVLDVMNDSLFSEFFVDDVRLLCEYDSELSLL
jgi:hypothetical protein